MKLNNKEKQIVANVIEGFINNGLSGIYENECVTFKELCEAIYDKPLGFELMLYQVFRETIFGMVKKEHTLNEEWVNDYAECVMEDKNYCLGIKKLRVKWKLDKVKEDFE